MEEGNDDMSTMDWSPMTHEEYDVLKDLEVYTSDNEKIGTIKEVLHPREEMPAARGRHYFKVEPGMLKQWFSDQEEFFLPERLIDEALPNEGKVILEVPKDSLKAQDWSRPPEFESFRRS